MKGIFKCPLNFQTSVLFAYLLLITCDSKIPKGIFFFIWSGKWLCKISVERIKFGVKRCETFSIVIESNKYKRINRNIAQGIRHSKKLSYWQSKFLNTTNKGWGVNLPPQKQDSPQTVDSNQIPSFQTTAAMLYKLMSHTNKESGFPKINSFPF